jgi:exodeoxyribonuclease V alpha subunit
MSDSSPQPSTPTEEVAGLVERVTFFNEESGFAGLRVNVRGQRELVTVLGSLPSVNAGAWLTAKGWWVRDKEHGLQFKATALKAVNAQSVCLAAAPFSPVSPSIERAGGMLTRQ